MNAPTPTGDPLNARDQERAQETEEVKQLAQGAVRAAEEVEALRHKVQTLEDAGARKDAELRSAAAHAHAGDMGRHERRGHISRGLEALRRVGLVAVVALFGIIAGALILDHYRPAVPPMVFPQGSSA